MPVTRRRAGVARNRHRGRPQDHGERPVPDLTPFDRWRRLRAERGHDIDVITLYELVAADRGIAPDQLPLEERVALSAWTLQASDEKFEFSPNSDREIEPIELVPYDPAWPLLFDDWKRRLLAALPAAPRGIEHVGSTAVPGMTAKPIVDIQVGVDNPENEAIYVPAIESLGVQLRSRDSEHRYFRPFLGSPREIHVHVCLAGGEWERQHLLFRDYLRASASARARYLDAKEAAAARWADDRMAYTDAKGKVIRVLMAEAEAWSSGS